MRELAELFPRLSITFSTIHHSKSLEADAVVILGLENAGKYGLPARFQEDPVLELVTCVDSTYEDAEERRVLYVALTRAKKIVVILASTSHRSAFFDELVCNDIVSVEGDFLEDYQVQCPLCATGKLVLNHPNKKKDTLLSVRPSHIAAGRRNFAKIVIKRPNLQVCFVLMCLVMAEICQAIKRERELKIPFDSGCVATLRSSRPDKFRQNTKELPSIVRVNSNLA